MLAVNRHPESSGWRGLTRAVLALSAALAWCAVVILFAGCATQTKYEAGKLSVIQQPRAPVGGMGEK